MNHIKCLIQASEGRKRNKDQEKRRKEKEKKERGNKEGLWIEDDYKYGSYITQL